MTCNKKKFPFPGSQYCRGIHKNVVHVVTDKSLYPMCMEFGFFLQLNLCLKKYHKTYGNMKLFFFCSFNDFCLSHNVMCSADTLSVVTESDVGALNYNSREK